MRFEGRRFDCGSKLGFLEAQIAHALARDDLNHGTRNILKKYK
jgi:UTP--glucose-1-phosphate uridylyltransferase